MFHNNLIEEKNGILVNCSFKNHNRNRTVQRLLLSVQ